MTKKLIQEMGCLYDEMVVAPPDNGRVEVEFFKFESRYIIH